MQFRLTFQHGFSHDFEADRLEDDGLTLELWAGEELVARYQDSDIVACERLDVPVTHDGDIYGHRNGVRLYDANGALVAAYRSQEAAAAA